MDANFESLLKARDLRATPIRLRILRALASAQQPLSADDLFTQLKSRRGTPIDRVTVYRSLTTFTEAGLVSRVELGLGKTLFEFSGGAPHHHHHHIRCERCEKIEHLEVCGLEMHFKMLESMGYRNLRHNLEFSGVCEACQ